MGTIVLTYKNRMEPVLCKAQQDFQLLVSSLPGSCKTVFMRWVKQQAEETLEEEATSNEDVILNQIREDLKQALPIDATFASEVVVFPLIGKNADCKAGTTIHVDSFLYDEDQVDELCDSGELSRNYCKSCGSKDTAAITFVSHSVSMKQIKYIYQFLLPDLHGKMVLDVGSRLGAVLYGGYFYSRAERLVGVEMNADFCRLQQSIIDAYCLSSRIHVVCSDICEQGHLVSQADIIVLHNVFEFFMPIDAQRTIWQFLRSTACKAGCLLVISPSLPECLNHLNCGIDIDKWVRTVDIHQKQHLANLHLFPDRDSEDNDLDNIFVYEVLPS